MHPVSSCRIDHEKGIRSLHPNINYRFNPFEIAITGDSRSNVISLANGLIQELSRSRRIGVVADYDMGKDLENKEKSKFDPILMGAVSTLIVGETHFTQSNPQAMSNYDLPAALIDADIVLILGEPPNPATAKILVMDKNPPDLDDVFRRRKEKLNCCLCEQTPQFKNNESKIFLAFP